VPVLLSAANNVARFDHNPVTGESLGLLIEEQRTNLLVRSEEFDNAAWTKTRVSVAANTIVAPDGTLTADKLVENTDTNTHRLDVSFTWVSGTTYTNTLYAKAAERTAFRIQFPAAAFTSVFADFDLSAGTVNPASGVTASITDVGNGWYRCAVTGTATASTTASILNALLVGGSASYTGNGYSGLYIWGAQLEAGAFPTSYIPTVASQVTRSVELAVMTGENFSSWYNQAEGTFYFDADMYETQSTFFRHLLAANDASGSTTNIVALTVPASSSLLRQLINSSGVVSSASQSAITLGAGFKAASAYKTNDFAISYSTGVLLTDALGNVPINVNRLYINALADSGVGANSSTHIRKVAFYPKRLANDQLQGITTV
jgi:hypothetical protein